MVSVRCGLQLFDSSREDFDVDRSLSTVQLFANFDVGAVTRKCFNYQEVLRLVLESFGATGLLMAWARLRLVVPQRVT